MTPVIPNPSLLRLLQLTSPALPVGAYSYSEGLESLVDQGLTDPGAILQWLQQELAGGLVRLDGAVVYRVHRAATEGDWVAIVAWNQWLSALREGEESRQQSWAMGRALGRLMTDLHPPLLIPLAPPWNFAVIFALAAHHWQMSTEMAVLGYLHSWASNLITNAVKLVPLGQTQGQQLLLDLYPALEGATQHCQGLETDDLTLSSWGTGLAAMHHETMYTRLFRS
jgi:urease accessory protein